MILVMMVFRAALLFYRTVILVWRSWRKLLTF